MRNETEVQFNVTVSRLATEDMVYAIRNPEGGKPVLYKIMIAVIEDADAAVKQLRVGSELCVEVAPDNPGHVVRAQLVTATHKRPVRDAVRKVFAGRGQR
jgi:hypothetical protein